MSRFIPPKVEDAALYPIPPPPRNGRPKQKRAPKISPWLPFLSTVKAGETFAVDYTTGQSVKKYLTELQMVYQARWMRIPGEFRFWILEQPYIWEPPFHDRGLDI